jgi:hypothetical protein
MDCIRCVCCEKFQHNFVARICALIASVRRVLHQSSCSKETFRNILTQLHCTKLCTIITPVQHVLHRLSCSNKMVRNTPRQEFGIKWNGSGAFIVKKCRHDFVAQTCALIAPVQLVLYQSSCNNKIVQNGPKMSLGSNEVDQVRSLRKFPTPHRCTNLCINCTSSACFAPTFLQ